MNRECTRFLAVGVSVALVVLCGIRFLGRSTPGTAVDSLPGREMLRPGGLMLPADRFPELHRESKSLAITEDTASESSAVAPAAELATTAPHAAVGNSALSLDDERSRPKPATASLVPSSSAPSARDFAEPVSSRRPPDLEMFRRRALERFRRRHLDIEVKP